MEMVELGPLTAEQKAELEGDELDPFGETGVTLRYRPKERHFALADDDGRLVASAGTIAVDVEVGAERFPVVGIGGVIVRAPYRGRGLARRVVEAALDGACAAGPARAMLLCRAARMGFSDRLAFAALTASVASRQPGS